MKRSERSYERLCETLADVRRLLIITHDNPDPDCLASGWVLRHIVRRRLELEATLAYEGVVGRAENRAMVSLLRIPIQRLRDLKLERFDAALLVDTQPRTGNNSLPPGLEVRAVVDHHPVRAATRRVAFRDVRPEYGATASIATEYLICSGLPIAPRLATGLFYAIRSETQNLGREGTSADLRAFLTLFPKVDNHMISRIEQAPVSRHYLALLEGAFRATRIYDDVSITRLERMPYPDVPAELADLLLRVDRVRWSLVMGSFRGDLYLSLRTERVRVNAARKLAEIVGDLGRTGGHGKMAGGRIEVRKTGRPAQRILGDLARRAREVLGAGSARGVRLLSGIGRRCHDP